MAEWPHGLAEVLMPEVLGVISPLLAALDVAPRLRLQAACQDADRAVRCFARAQAELQLATGTIDVELIVARGDLEEAWALTRLCGSMSHVRSLSPSAEEVKPCPLLLYALAGKRVKMSSLLRFTGEEEVLPLPKDILRKDALQAASTGDQRTVLQLLASGLSVNAGWTFGWTMLMSAAGGNQVRMAEVLLALGALPNVPDSAGKRAVDVATMKGHKEVLETLKAYSLLGRR